MERRLVTLDVSGRATTADLREVLREYGFKALPHTPLQKQT